ncbi:MAG: hypothetical protein A2297_03355 [Elusimicrobia bacterium RIFOXYB2_FULL_48_7]|nr:MAG: hypothetical protein A2297_03355 [Elusimicrobia bacterium RIFOXYB2_FULL_48_7]
MKKLVFLALLFGFSNCFAEDIASFASSAEKEAVYARLDDDQSMFLVYHNELSRLLQYMSDQKDVFPSKKYTKSRLLKPKIKKEALSVWQSYLDYYLALDSLSKYYETFEEIKNEDIKSDSFRLFNALFLTEYRFALEFINIVENDPGFNTVFNEPLMELGLPSGTYSAFKLRYLNLLPALKFASVQAVYSVVSNSPNPDMDDLITDDSSVIWKMGLGTGEALMVSNIFEIAKGMAYFPVRAGLAEVLTNRGAAHINNNIPQDEIKKILPGLKPGDILLERHEDAVALIGIPGFWTHAALYIGTPDERKEYFKDSDVDILLREMGCLDGDFEAYLSTTYPAAYQSGLLSAEQNHNKRIIEAITRGVSFASIEYSGNFDYIAVLRPRLDKKDIARAVIKAFSCFGRPYDFDFDFLTDSELICSELIYKVYEPDKDENGLDFKLSDVAGYSLLSPNDIVQKFDEEYGGKKQQLDFVCFIDKNGENNAVVNASVEEFRKSWQRPKWNIEKPSKLK